MSACAETCIRPGIGSRTEHCKVCHQSFVGTRAGDLHGTGKHGVRQGTDRRRCLTVEEMSSRGMVRNPRGLWSEGNANRKVQRSAHPHGAPESYADSRQNAA